MTWPDRRPTKAEWAFGKPNYYDGTIICSWGGVPTERPAYDPAVFALRRVRHFQRAEDNALGFPLVVDGGNEFWIERWWSEVYLQAARRAAEAVR